MRVREDENDSVDVMIGQKRMKEKVSETTVVRDCDVLGGEHC